MKKYLIAMTLLVLFIGCTDKTAVVSVGDKEGLIDENGEVQVKPIYKRVNNLDTVETNSYHHPHFINFHWMHLSGKEYAIVKSVDNKYGIIDKDGNLKQKLVYDSIGQFINGFAKVELNGKYGLINENLELVLKPIYEEVRDVMDGIVIARKALKDNKSYYGCLNTDMQIVAPFEYDMIYLSNEDRMRIEKDNLWGFMDTDCKVVVKPQYKYVDDFSNSLAKVEKLDGLFTYINLDGKEIQRKTFNEGLDF